MLERLWNWLRGYRTEVKFCPYPLTPEEIEADYNAGRKRY